MRTLHSFFGLAALASPAVAIAQSTTPFAVATHTIQSAALDETRTIYVVTPPGYDLTSQRYPVLVLLDANDQPQFAAAVANVQFLGSRGAVPDLIIVGIPNGRDRTHDLTPVARGETARTFPSAGGAAEFVRFITYEVLPLVQSTYRALPSTVLAGHSFGGLLALHAAATNPGTFTGIVAMSPSLWWNDSAGVQAYVDSLAAGHGPLRLFTTSGGYEPPVDEPTRQFAERAERIARTDFAFRYQRYPDDTHTLTPQPSLVDGLRFVYEPVSLVNPAVAAVTQADSASLVAAFLETRRAYARGARLLGLTAALPEAFVNSLGYTVLAQHRNPGAAVWLLRQNVTNYPDSPNAYDSLGDALLAAGDTAAARREFQQAILVATRVRRAVSPETRRKLSELGGAK